MKLIHGDCLVEMGKMEANSVDSIVTDPPYGLSFMGRDWDHGIPGKPFWEAALRIAKPGAHLLAFGGTRTFHRLAVAIEDAGWEVRDTVSYLHDGSFAEETLFNSLTEQQQQAYLNLHHGQGLVGWSYGSGFPKSLNVAMTIDKLEKGHPQGSTKGDPDSPNSGKFKTQATEGKRSVSDKGQHFGAGPGQFMKEGGVKYSRELVEKAKQWNGWGTALKPAWEPIIVARKPLDGTVAGNVQRWGCGAINIDGCRVGFENGDTTDCAERAGGGAGFEAHNKTGRKYGKGLGGIIAEPNQLGRFPANLIHDGSDEVVNLFPTTGKSSGGTKKAGKFANQYGDFSGNNPGDSAGGFGDNGTAARFFYCAKASKSDRDEGCEALPTQKKINTTGKGLGNTLARCPEHDKPLPSGSLTYSCGCRQVFDTDQEERRVETKNIHPTVKPTDLMRYLVRLVTPPGGVVLDPFMGSGSTGKAALLEGFDFIGIEKEGEYLSIAEARIGAAGKASQPVKKAKRKGADK